LAIYYGFSLIETYDVFSEFVFNNLLPIFICAYFSFGIMPLVFQKCHLNSKNDQNSLVFDSGLSMHDMA
jgi:hypothetical protein